MPPRGAVLLMMMVSRIRWAKWVGILGLLVAVAAIADRFRSAAVAMCYGGRPHMDSRGYLGHPLSGGGIAPSVLSANKYSAGPIKKKSGSNDH